jgi:hypothetical protein
MFPTNLTTNEVKDVAGTEVEYLRLRNDPLEFAKSGESPNLRDRITVKHSETGSGAGQVRRSVLDNTKEVVGESGVERQIRVYTVVVAPIGDLADYDDVKDVMAKHISVLASQGASTTILYDCTGHGAAALVNGTN